MEATEITWTLSPEAWEFVRGLPPEVLDQYDMLKSAFKRLICSYINVNGRCDVQALGVSPMGKHVTGGKELKVRLAVPGRGKRGSLRLAVVAFCDDKAVRISDACWRRDAG